MKASDLLSLLQLAVGLNLGFGAVLSFLQSLRDETQRYQTAFEPYIQQGIAQQDRGTEAFRTLLDELCRQYAEFEHQIWRIGRKASLYNSVMLHVVFGALTLASLALLIMFSALGDTQIGKSWLAISSLLNIAPVILFFRLSFLYGQYAVKVRPMAQTMYQLMRRLEAKRPRT
jgi:hypothetical protein